MGYLVGGLLYMGETATYPERKHLENITFSSIFTYDVFKNTTYIQNQKSYTAYRGEVVDPSFER